MEYGAEPPKESDFWLAQRAALALPAVGFAVSTDIQRALHPPDKQDVATRLTLELRRLAYAEDVVSRGPALVASSPQADGTVALTFSNASLAVHSGILVGDAAACAASAGNDTMATSRDDARRSLSYTIHEGTVTVDCPPGVDAVHINADAATCFLYGPSGLPAPPVIANCSAARGSGDDAELVEYRSS